MGCSSWNVCPKKATRRSPAKSSRAPPWPRSNKSAVFAAVSKMGEPEQVMDEQSRQEVYRYLARVRLEKPVVRNPEAARSVRARPGGADEGARAAKVEGRGREAW